MKRISLFLLGVLALPAWAAPGTMIKNEDLRATPSSGGARLATVAKGSAVEVLARQGGWTQVRAGGRTGWVRILSVRSSVGAASAADLAALASRRDNQVVAVAGLRGLNEEELKAAKFDAGELAQLDRYRVEQAEAAEFARAGNLVARNLAYIREPKPAPATSAPAGGGFDFFGGGQ
ncbi:MAG: SH3 domain-containing protein [Pseudomonadota bacterium]